MIRATTLLNEQGDVTIIWDEENDEKMVEVIKKKMAEGIQFFIIEPRFGGRASPAKTPLKKAADATKHRALSIRDEDFAAMVEAGAAEVERTPDTKVKTVRKSTDAKEVARSESVGIRQRRGG
jgi:hypothetical protein